MSKRKSAEPNRRQQQAIERKRRSQRIKLALSAGAVILLGSVVGGLWFTSRPSTEPDLSAVQSFEHEKPTHVSEPVVYKQSPPTGGDHSPVWQNCGAYARPVSSEQGVHSMEHGAVWITYRADLGQDQINSLRSISRERDYVLLSPAENLDSPVVASAWGKQLRLDSADDERLDAFIREYMKGEQTPEPGAPCTSGEGTPT